MSLGLAGDNSTTGGDQTAQLMLVELRALSNLIQAQTGTAALEDLNGIRQDIANSLGVTPLPIPVSL